MSISIAHPERYDHYEFGSLSLHHPNTGKDDPKVWEMLGVTEDDAVLWGHLKPEYQGQIYLPIDSQALFDKVCDTLSYLQTVRP